MIPDPKNARYVGAVRGDKVITECGAARYVGTDPNGYVWVAYGTQNFDDLCEKFDNPARQRRRAK